MNRSASNQEVELKFELGSSDARKLRRKRLLSGCDTQPQETVYYDTARQDVRNAGFTLRVRKAGDRFIQTVKSANAALGLLSRAEWESMAARFEPDCDALKSTPLGQLRGLRGKLEPTVRSSVERSTCLLDHRGSAIELVIDEGAVRNGSHQRPFCELELELKQGSPEDLFDLARRLGKQVPLRLGVLSKQERGQRLADELVEGARKAPPLHIARDMTVGATFAAIVHACLRHYRLNDELVIIDRSVEALHQARVALRRLRAALALFAPAIRKSTLKPIRSELRWLTDSLGDARNLDVFSAGHRDQLSARDRRKLKQARKHAYDEVIAAIASQRSRELLLALLEWLETAPWQEPQAAGPIEPFAAGRLDQLLEPVRSAAAELKQLDDEQLHELRIDIKKLRYAIEFLGALYDPKPIRKLTEALKQLQDNLGDMNDQAVARELAAELGLNLPEVPAPARRRQLAAIGRMLARVERVGRPWAS